jgi:ATP-dependent Lhr-like helicase
MTMFLGGEDLPLLGILRHLEARGEVRGGRFVSGFGGEQFE